MKKYIDAWENAVIAETRESEYCTAHICTDDLFKDNMQEQQNQKISNLVQGALYRQSIKKKSQSTE